MINALVKHEILEADPAIFTPQHPHFSRYRFRCPVLFWTQDYGNGRGTLRAHSHA